MNNAGKIFRKIRKEKGLSLMFVADGICAVSTVSRFENGQGDIPLNKFLLLLKKLAISPFEFFKQFKTKYDRNNEFLNTIALHYSEGNKNLLKEDVLQKQSDYHLTSSRSDFFQYMTAVNLYNDLAEVLLCTNDELCKLKNYIFKTEHWGWDEIITFGNTLGLLSESSAYVLCTELLNQIKLIEKYDFSLSLDAWYAVINCYQKLIFHKSQFAKKLDNRLLRTKPGNYLTEVNIQLYFFHQLYMYNVSKNKTYLSKAKNTINFLDQIQCSELAKSLEKALTSLCV